MAYCMIEAHTGVSSEAPFNTMASFRLAKEQGYDMIELDTKFTKDGHCVILHDRTVNRTARNEDGSAIPEDRFIADMTLAEAKTLDFGIFFSEKYKGERIPTLEEVLTFAVTEKIPLKFDNVIQTHTDEELAAFIDCIKNMNAQPYVGFTSNNLPFIEKLLAMLPGSAIHYDGPSDEKTLTALCALVPKEKLTVWVRFDNARTSWNKTPAANEEYCAMVKRYARLGLWILDKKEEYIIARDRFHADIVETDGTLKPEKTEV